MKDKQDEQEEQEEQDEKDKQDKQRPNLKNLNRGLNLRRGLNMDMNRINRMNWMTQGQDQDDLKVTVFVRCQDEGLIAQQSF